MGRIEKEAPVLSEQRPREATRVEGDDEEFPPWLENASALREDLVDPMKMFDDVEERHGREVRIRERKARFRVPQHYIAAESFLSLTGSLRALFQPIRIETGMRHRFDEKPQSGTEVENSPTFDATMCEQFDEIGEVLPPSFVEGEVLPIEISMRLRCHVLE